MRRLLPLLVLLLLFSCAEEQFSLSSVSLSLSRSVSAASDSEIDSDSLYLSCSVSIPDSVYTFRVTSPDGDLVWEGAMTGEGEEKRSEPLLLTPGASFPEGTYSILIYSDNGTEMSTEAVLQYDDAIRSFLKGQLSSDAVVTEYADDGTELRSGSRSGGYILPDDAFSVLVEYEDRYGNAVSVSQSFQPSPSDPSLSAL